MKNKLYKLAYYCRGLGIFGGIRAITTIFLNKKNKVVSIRTPGIAHPVHIRAKSSDEYAFRQVLLGREYDITYKGTPQTIIDAGSNIGLAAVYFANRFSNARIICVEPEPSNMEILQMNIKPYPNISAIQAGLWGKSTYLAIRDEGNGNWGFIVEECSKETPGAIRAVSLPEIMQEFQLKKLDIIKMDIEGSEKEVLEAENASEWISKCNVLVIELHDRMKPGTSSALFRLLLNFKDVQVAPKGENFICTFPSHANQ